MAVGVSDYLNWHWKDTQLQVEIQVQMQDKFGHQLAVQVQELVRVQGLRQALV